MRVFPELLRAVCPAAAGNVGRVTEHTTADAAPDAAEAPEGADRPGDGPSVLVRASDGVGHVTLNRPQTINALDLEMTTRLTEALHAWVDDPDVALVLLDGAGGRGLCAGGDVRGLRTHIIDGRPGDTGVFFRAEYALNALIAEYPKPIVAIADGVTMGGGIGLAGHAAVRIVTERSRLAMPETRIGFTPDVGGSRLLARAPGRTGEYLALTGASMDAADALYAGFADAMIPSERLDDLRDALRTRADPGTPAELVLLFDETPGASALEAAREWIDDAFAADTVAGIIARLQARPESEAAAAAAALEQRAPTALIVTLAAVRAARALPDLRSTLAQEYGLVQWFAYTQPDLVEGIRAQIVDKDRAPRWRPAALADVAPGIVDEAFGWRPPVALWS